LGNDTEVYGANLTAVLVSGSTNGTLNLNSDGGFNYSPATDYYGIDSFIYQVSDGATNLGTATVNLTVNYLCNPPVVSNAPVSVTTCSGTSASFSVSATGSGLGYQWYQGGNIWRANQQQPGMSM